MPIIRKPKTRRTLKRGVAVTAHLWKTVELLLLHGPVVLDVVPRVGPVEAETLHEAAGEVVAVADQGAGLVRGQLLVVLALEVAVSRVAESVATDVCAKRIRLEGVMEKGKLYLSRMVLHVFENFTDLQWAELETGREPNS